MVKIIATILSILSLVSTETFHVFDVVELICYDVVATMAFLSGMAAAITHNKFAY
jgi:hypothetical protein